MKKVKKTTKKATKKSVVEIPSMMEMLEAGVHFGHERSKKNPKMNEHIFMLRNKMAIIDLEKTQEGLVEASKFIAEIAAVPTNEILFVGTKRQARTTVKKYAEAVNMPYVTQRWLGGMLTNFATILKSIEKLEELKNVVDDEKAMAKITKKERGVQMKEIERLERVLEGTKDLKKPPAALIAIGAYDEKLAIREAKRVGIPVVAIADTNANPQDVGHPIPGNDDAIRSIDLIVKTLTEAIAQARGIKLDIKEPEIVEKSDEVKEGDEGESKEVDKDTIKEGEES